MQILRQNDFFLDFNQNWNVEINFSKNPKYVISQKNPFARVALFHADRRTYTTRLIVAFRNCYENAPKGTRIVQADSGTDPDSENWRRSPRRLPAGWDRRVEAD